ncbi:endonuclease [Chryseobacterium oryzae]|uniref:Endonuclease n=1 Tax=Chryseobacterium oryzae TaxID=2929799 RepID=A0ABY4BSB2_9FLAO|nr:endonuclease [Chryseobacterium oryzae]UOE39460.1 endonuclease [Chryseobacterium oryzae]
MQKTLVSIFFLSVMVSAQAPSGYYNGTSGLTGYALKSKLHEIISNKFVNWHYGDLPNFYNQTDLDKYYDHGPSNTTILLDIYSEIPNGPDLYEYTSANVASSASAEGAGYNREHMMPQSTFNGNYPMYSDIFYIIPADAYINQRRSNYPYGIANSTIYNTFSNGSKIGNSGIPNYPYASRVYEPIDEFKGDVARSLLYFVVRYEGKLNSFNYDYSSSSTITPANDQCPLDGTEERAFDNAYIAMLLQWHQQDPVSQREIDRNNAVYNLQKNRNPFIDNPSWVNDIWGQTPDNIAPQSPQNLTVTQNSAYFNTLSWSPSSSSDVIGYKIYQNGVLIGSTRETTFSADHLNPSTSYTYTVKAYDNGYLLSADSNSISATTLGNDSYAKDLIITKYLEGTSNNKAIEITNKTGHSVNLNNYRLFIQFPSSSSYYFPSPYELEGIIENNESFVVINPSANFSCYTVDQAKLATSAPQMTYSGSQYLELRYKSSPIDVMGVSGVNNSSVLANVSLYRKSTVNQPANLFSITEWNSYPSNYCQNLGNLATEESVKNKENNIRIYPNPAEEFIFVEGATEKISTAKIFDMSGRLMISENNPFRNKKSITVKNLSSGNYLLNLEGKVYQFIKK